MRGFTLVEMMITLALAAILVSVAVPSYIAIVNNNRLTSAANDLLSDILLTRSEAVKREARVTICKKTADSSDCKTTGDWSEGWIVFVDGDADARVDAGELPVLAANEGPPPNVTISGDGVMADYISYVATGRSRQNNGMLLNGTLTITTAGKEREVIVAPTGRPRIKQ